VANDEGISKSKWRMGSARELLASVGDPPTGTATSDLASRLSSSGQTVVQNSSGEVFSVVAARATERGLQSAGALVSERGFGILPTRLYGAHVCGINPALQPRS